MRRFWFLFIPVLLCLGTVPGAQTAPFQLSESQLSAVEFEVQFPVPTWTTQEINGETYRFLTDLDCSDRLHQLEVQIPAQVFEVAVPPTGQLEIETQATTRGSARGVRFPPALVWEEPEPSRLGERKAATRQIFNPTPNLPEARTPQARLLGISTERGLRIASIEVAPVVWDPSTNTAVWAEKVNVRVRVSGAKPLRATRPVEDQVGQQAWKTRLVNPESAARWQQARQPDEAGIPERWFDDATQWVKLRITENGMYGITPDDLEDLGIDVSAIDPRQFRLMAGPLIQDAGFDAVEVNGGGTRFETRYRHVYEKTGFVDGFETAKDPVDGREGMLEHAIWVTGSTDGSFDADDVLHFYALGPDNFEDRFLPGGSREEFVYNSYTNETVYWLTWDFQSANAPKRMAATAVARLEPASIREVNVRGHFEGNTWYDPSMYIKGERWEEWFWEPMSNIQGPVQKRLDIPRYVEGSPMSGRIRFWGANLPQGDQNGNLHHVRAELNGELIDIAVWGGGGSNYTPFDLRFENLIGTIDPAFRFEVPEVGSFEDRVDFSHLTWIQLNYRAHLDAAGDFLEFELEPGALNKVVEIQNIPAGEGLVFDVSDSRNPIRIGGGDGAGTYEFAVPTDDGGTFALTTDQALATPVMELDTQPARWLRDTSEPLDYVIITYDDFGDAANMLADWRRDHLYGVTEERPAHVRVVNVSDVYDEFSYGMKDPAAIRYFLEYAFRYYGGAGADPLAYCVFLGDHTQDPRDNQGTGVLDYVTSWQDNRDSINFIRFGNVQYVSDDPLARFDGLTDTSTDLYLGRITVRTAAEARTLVRDKIIRNEANPDRGPWRNKVILVADDACQGRSDDSIALNHMTQTERVDTSIPQAFDRDKVYLWEYGEDCIVDSKPDAKRALLSTWTEGAWAVNYIGHGADVVLADEHVFDQVDIPLLGNDGRYPVFGAFSCSVGKFGKPLGEGLGEGLFKAPAGGALASMVATSITFSGANANLNQRFYEHMFPGEPTSPAAVGVALMDAKRGTADGNIKYVCIGDPASRPSVPERAMVVNGPTEMNRGDTVFMSLSIDGDPVDGVVDVRAQDAREAREAVFTNSRGQTTRTTYLRTGSNLYRGLAEAVTGDASVDFVVPLSLREGSDGRIRSYAWGETWDALGALTPLAVGGEGFSPSDSTGPEAVFQLPSEVAIPGQTIEIVLEDPAGIDITQLFAFRGILLRIRDTQGIEQLRLDLTDNFAYDLGSSRRGTTAFTVPELPSGSYEFVLSSFDNFTNKSETSASIILGEAGAEARFESVWAYPNPTPKETQVHFRLDRPGALDLKIYTVSGRLVWEESMEAKAGENRWTWIGEDRAGDAVANGVYLLQMTFQQADRKDPVKHLERLVVYR